MDVLKNNRGFSLVEVLLGAAGIGVVVLALMNLTNQHAKNQANVEAKFSGQELKQIITNLFYNKDACTNSLGGSTIGSQINGLKNPANEMIFSLNDKFGANNLIMSSFQTIDTNRPLTPNTRLVNLIVTFKKSKMITNQANLAVAIPLKVTASGPNAVIVDCSSYDDKFVQKSGDTMTGALVTTELTATNSVSATESIQGQMVCTGPTCKRMNDFVVSNQSCSDKQFMDGVQNAPRCRSLSFSCPPKQVIRAIGPNGQVTCVDLIPPGCPAMAFAQSGQTCTVPAREHGQTGSCSTNVAGECKWGHYGDRGAGWGWRCKTTFQVWFGGGNYAEGQCRANCKSPGVTITKTCNKGTWE